MALYWHERQKREKQGAPLSCLPDGGPLGTGCASAVGGPLFVCVRVYVRAPCGGPLLKLQVAEEQQQDGEV
ncbi:hypothetical protein Emed_000867 [Eimeria media]